MSAEALRLQCLKVPGGAMLVQIVLLSSCQLVAGFDLFQSIGRLVGQQADSEAVSGESPAPYALFTHDAKQLHCADRELRHPCVTELSQFLKDRTSSGARQNALDCVNSILESSEDYWELKNMTHLLLDLDTVDHVFDKESRDNDFIHAGVAFAKKLMAHPDCMKDFDAKSELECRCVPLYGKVSTLKLKNAGRIDEAQKLFKEISQMSWEGKTRKYAPGEAVPWDDFQHTPQIWAWCPAKNCARQDQAVLTMSMLTMSMLVAHHSCPTYPAKKYIPILARQQQQQQG
eukprot:s366_g5.t1